MGLLDGLVQWYYEQRVRRILCHVATTVSAEGMDEFALRCVTAGMGVDLTADGDNQRSLTVYAPDGSVLLEVHCMTIQEATK